MRERVILKVTMVSTPEDNPYISSYYVHPECLVDAVLNLRRINPTIKKEILAVVKAMQGEDVEAIPGSPIYGLKRLGLLDVHPGEQCLFCHGILKHPPAEGGHTWASI